MPYERTYDVFVVLLVRTKSLRNNLLHSADELPMLVLSIAEGANRVIK
jgi:hypothetical protein